MRGRFSDVGSRGEDAPLGASLAQVVHFSTGLDTCQVPRSARLWRCTCQAAAEREQEHIRRALHRQTLRLEEQDDPNHPVVAAAKQRIEELTSRQAATEHAIQDIETRRPQGIRPDEIEATLHAIPDLRDELRKATPEELADLLDAFEVTATYDKAEHQLHLAATVPSGLVSENEKPPTRQKASGDSFIAGGGFARSGDSWCRSSGPRKSLHKRGSDDRGRRGNRTRDGADRRAALVGADIGANVAIASDIVAPAAL